MTQFPFGAPAQQFPSYPPQPTPDQYAPQGYPAYAAQPQQFAPQGFPQFPAQAQPGFGGFPQQPRVAIPPGSLSAFMGQPKTGRPNSISWKGAPDGTTLVGIIAEDVSDRDVIPDTDPNTKQPRTFRDGSPKYVLVVTLRVQPSPAFPDGLASLYCRGDLWEKLSAAMIEAGRTDQVPRAGDTIQVTLVERKPGQGTAPKNVFAVRYGVSGQETAPAPTPAPAPVAQQWAAPQAPAVPTQEPLFPAQAPVAQAPVAQAPVAQAPVAQAPVAQAPVAQAPQFAVPAPQAPAGMPALSADQQALLAQLRGQ